MRMALALALASHNLSAIAKRGITDARMDVRRGEDAARKNYVDVGFARIRMLAGLFALSEMDWSLPPPPPWSPIMVAAAAASPKSVAVTHRNLFVRGSIPEPLSCRWSEV